MSKSTWRIDPEIAKKLVGRRIMRVELDSDHDSPPSWNSQVLLELDDNVILFAWRDAEGNGPGVLVLGDREGAHRVLPQRCEETPCPSNT